MNLIELRSSLADRSVVAAAPFEILRELSVLVSTESDEAREMVLRALDSRDAFGSYYEILDALVRQLGLYPYLDPVQLSGRDLLAYEFHRPKDLGEHIVFHSVQAEVYQELLSGTNVILSAPTSFGKSLVIDALIASGQYARIVIVVPTIALIDETRRRLNRFREQFEILTHPTSSEQSQSIHVLTQERVLGCEDLSLTDLFIVDEFYKLSPEMDGERSAILNQAFYRLFKTGAQFYLLGPDIRELPPGLPTKLDCRFIRTDFVTVASDAVRISADNERDGLVGLCRSLSEPTLIFCRSPQRVRAVAEWLLEDGVSGNPRDLEAACDWMGSEFHEEWVTTRSLANGVALHHGRIPRALSQFMVRAFNEGRAQFLVCTSTLIEGVNTKAKNVIVFDNKIARRKFDYFTFNNIRGRSGRMFEHFVGKVFLFHDPPQVELPFVDFPIVTQPDDTPTSVLVQIDDEDLAPRSRVKLGSILNQTDLSLAVIRDNAGFDPDNQIALAREIRVNASEYRAKLYWSRIPQYRQLKFACELCWKYFSPRGGATVFSASQLAFKINRLRAKGSIRALVDLELASGASPDDAVEGTLEFIRQWAAFSFPRMLAALNRIQESVYEDLDLEPGDYSLFGAMVENLFMPAPLAALDEYGIPHQTALKFRGFLSGIEDLRLALDILRDSDLADVPGLDPFEVELLEDAQDHI